MEESAPFATEDSWSHAFAKAKDSYSKKEEGDYGAVDYTVLSVAVITLGLILLVELARHKIDHKARGRPFFTTVLEGIYSELATLGLVEFFVFLVKKYYDGLNKGAKSVFADVHFMLMYCAIFNAIMSGILAFFCTRISRRDWVTTEQLELDHYIEIREEFERLDAKLYGGSTEEFVFEYNPSSVGALFQRILRKLRHPILSRRHKALMAQVRFHDLRVHFIKANHLPLQFRISDYLKRSELHILQHLVHISAFAWLLLTGLINLIYFLMGIVVSVTSDVWTVGESLTWIYIGGMIAAVILSLMIYNKMKWIFQRIMRMKLISQTDDFKTGASIRKGDKHVDNQRDLFWGGNPNYITVLIQFMQFGFAVAFSILLVFWDDIHVEGAPIPGWGYIVGALLCYLAFVFTMARVIPWYTLCTSLGQLVNKGDLQDTLADFQLEEAKRKQRLRIEYPDDDDDDKFFDTDTTGMDDASSLSKDSPAGQTKDSPAGQTISVRTAQESLRSQEDEKPTLLAELVQMDTQSLRTIVPFDQSTARSKSIRDRRLRRKSVSDGVAAMRSMSNLQQVPKLSGSAATAVAQVKAPQPGNLTRKKSLSASASIGQMRNANDNQVQRPRRVRQKSVSASAVIQQMQDVELSDEIPPTASKTTDDIGRAPPRPRVPSVRLSSRPSTGRLPRNSRSNTSLSQLLEHRPLADGGGEEASRQDYGFFVTESAAVDDVSVLSTGLNLSTRTTSHDKDDDDDDKQTLLAELVQTDTGSLRSAHSTRSKEIRDRRMRRKTVSDGVASMRSMTTLQDLAPIIKDEEKVTSAAEKESTDASCDEQVQSTEPTSEKMSTASPVVVGRVRSSSRSDQQPARTKSVSASSIIEQMKEMEIYEDEMPKTTLPIKDKPGLEITVIEESSEDGSGDFDLPKIDVNEGEKYEEESILSLNFHSSAREYFLGRKYPVVSAVFGTMVAFFLVGQRIEGLLLATGVLPDMKNTFQFALGTSFWWETTFLGCFIVASAYIVSSFQLGHTSTKRERVLVLGSLLDVFLSAACLTLLMVAEWQRCACSEGDNDADCCRPFGTRYYGGVGLIEPFTSLVALRLTRFWVAKKLSPHISWGASSSSSQASANSGHDANHSHGSHHGGHGDHGGGDSNDVVKMWKSALSQYPEVVEQHGEFSGELLQAMLGIDVVEEPVDHQHAAIASSQRESRTDSKEPKPVPKPTHQRQRSLAAEQRRADLSAQAHSIIVASSPRAKTPKAQNRTAEPKTPPEFRDTNMLSDDSDEEATPFLNPNAKLLRSMHRCDRKLLPLIDTWSSVDVVMTKFEIVYFDASDADGLGKSRKTPKQVAALETCRQALTASKGGKGMRLRDVAAGRKVVGHLVISSIDSIHVDRVLPHEDDMSHHDGNAGRKETQDEFWTSQGSKPSESGDQPSRQSRWCKVKEDRLVIHSKCGSLCLRFYSDLDDSEKHIARCLSEDECKGSLFKNNAFLWCQSLARLCKRNQLKQRLDHYGDDDEEELRDYLRVVDSKAKEGHDSVMDRIHRRTSSIKMWSARHLHQHHEHDEEHQQPPQLPDASGLVSVTEESGTEAPSPGSSTSSTKDVPPDASGNRSRGELEVEEHIV